MPCVPPALSLANSLLQQLESTLRDPLLGPHLARQVASTLQEVLHPPADAPPYVLDQAAYARLWSCTADRGQQALISLASI